MAIDPYGMCPCGSGKKIKFCCSDLVGEIEKIYRMIEGDQPRAALRHVEQALASHPGRASLLDLKTTLELSLGELETAGETARLSVQQNPDSATAHAGQALVLAECNEALAAVESLQRAIALIDRTISRRVYEAVGSVGGALLKSGHILAAQAHLWLYAVLSPRDDARGREVLVALNQYSGLPLLVRDRQNFRPWPQDAPWHKEAMEASRWADQGKWQQAVAIVDRLGAQHGADPSLLFNRSLLAGWLGDDRTMVAGLHAFAQLEVPLDDAVEAEAIAQLLDPDQKEPRIDTIVRRFEVKDLDSLMARLAADKRIVPTEIPDEEFDEENPRPRQAYSLLDRPMPDSGKGLTREQVPQMSAVLAVYGRQTDRNERLEITLERGPDFDRTMSALQEIGGDALGSSQEDEVINTVARSEHALRWRWYPPRDTPRELLKKLNAEERRAAIVERWPSLPNLALGDKTPREVAADPQYRIPLLAAVLIIEHSSGMRDAEAVAELRRDLNLPEPASIEPVPGQALSTLPLVRVPRLNVSALSDDDLVQLYRRAGLVSDPPSIARLALEAVRRPSVANHIRTEDAYHRLVMAEREPESALKTLEEARQWARQSNTSTAPWDILELEIRLAQGHVDKVRDTLERIDREHGHDPEVAAALYQLLYDAGVVPDDHELLPHAHGHHHDAHDERPTARSGTAESSAPGRIWTPGSDRPSGGKSALWTPS
ncbi:MAG: hypothetical protein IT425_07925 [Pirellulales bacterium]|nr:hypothetical protein [Pirellulales bacterium]